MITVFTPTYNRAYILNRCYQSLVNQTTHNFKWLIVDDGSSDHTEDLVKQWLAEGKVDITYIKQTNAGKPAAHNTGVLNCTTELFICLDSDDFFRADAIETIYKEWEAVKTKDYIVGLAMLKAYSDGKLTGTYLPEEVNETSIYDLYEKYHFKGELTLIFRTKIIQEYLFPIFEGRSLLVNLLSMTY
ncbi:glycosyltransferase family A protein [Cellulosilyticum ruminicola]|uniref:glycosyltransferase family A protein n=1 Tax=Cellulosilyticum ruminicola TaxID=425254 RepID=UPI0006D2AEDC|nr:glycosyltransferase family A protein [Cellulosilyticum ruminicola]